MGAEILLAAAFAGGALCVLGKRPRRPHMGWQGFALWASLLFLGGFTLRLALGYGSQGFSTDIDTFKSWARIANQVGLSKIYQQDIFLDYPPGYLYVLVILEKLRLFLGLPSGGAAFTLVMKLPSILSDLLCAGVLLYAGKRKLGEQASLALAAAYLFCPAIFVNSAQWGQADSFCTALLLSSLLLLYREWYAPSAALYGISIACKPQMLIFAPLYLFFAIKRRRWGGLLLGVVITVGVVLLTAAPFTQNFNFLWLLRKYQSTLNYYDYYSVNAYNLWALLGKNWVVLPQGPGKAALTLAAPVLATLACGVLLLGSSRKETVFAAPFVLMSVMYALGVKMHERYLFPAFFFVPMSFVFFYDRRLIRAFGLLSALNYLNVAHVLYLFREKGGSYDPNDWVVRLLAGAQLLSMGYLIWVVFSICLRGRVIDPLAAVSRSPLRFPAWGETRFTRADWVLMAAVTLVYGTVAFWRLGSLEMPTTAWTPQQGESVVLEASEECGVLCYLPGLAADNEGYAARTGVNLRVETSLDGKAWTDCGVLEESYVFAWKQYRLETPGVYVRLTALDETAVLNEAALKLLGQSKLAPVKALQQEGSALTDEQEKVPLYTTYENSSYFDEIYHARTAYEHILGLEPYENTHPPLGKHIISLGIRLFGMNPFGWRCMGALFGVLMLPVFYHLLKQLVGKTWLCAGGVLLFAFDFMHFTQTRIATIDTYSVFFLLLMYDAMAVFLRRDLKQDGWGKLLPPLLCCGVFTGLGVASKWTAAYGALGLALLFFGKLGFAIKSEYEAAGALKPLLKKSLALCLWCCLFFLLIPFGLYFLAYLPLTTLPHNAGNLWGNFWNYQVTMFRYHSQLKAEHYFASPWYEWPFDVRPIWYFSADLADARGSYSTISAFGNPLLWWGGVPALAASAGLWIKKRNPACAVALSGFLSVYLPWVLVPRLTFIYHYFTATPFLVLALMVLFSQGAEAGFFSRRIRVGEEGSVSYSAVLFGAFAAGCLLLFALYFPVISGMATTRAYADALELFPTWYFA